jgi:hypothetical protein
MELKIFIFYVFVNLSEGIRGPPGPEIQNEHTNPSSKRQWNEKFGAPGVAQTKRVRSYSSEERETIYNRYVILKKIPFVWSRTKPGF